MVQVTREVYDQLMEVRDTGDVNMFDRLGVQGIANDMGFYALVVWIEDHKKEYGQLIMHGAEVVESVGNDV